MPLMPLRARIPAVSLRNTAHKMFERVLSGGDRGSHEPHFPNFILALGWPHRCLKEETKTNLEGYG